MVSALSVRRSRSRCSSARAGRQNEDAGAVGHRLAHLACALPIDLQQHILAGGELVAYLRGAGAVEIVEYLRVLEERAWCRQLRGTAPPSRSDSRDLQFMGTRRAGGVRNGDHQVRPGVEQRAHQAGLAGARRCRDDE